MVGYEKLIVVLELVKPKTVMGDEVYERSGCWIENQTSYLSILTCIRADEVETGLQLPGHLGRHVSGDSGSSCGECGGHC